MPGKYSVSVNQLITKLQCSEKSALVFLERAHGPDTCRLPITCCCHSGIMSSIPRRTVPFVSRPCLNNIPICLSCQWRLSNPAPLLAQAQQKRSITRVHINRIKEAMADWQSRATAIKKGEKQSMLSLLEERGFINQIVGFVKHHPVQSGITLLTKAVREKTLTTCSPNDELVSMPASILLLHHSMWATWSRLWCLDGSIYMDIHPPFWYSHCDLTCHHSSADCNSWAQRRPRSGIPLTGLPRENKGNALS